MLKPMHKQYLEDDFPLRLLLGDDLGGGDKDGVRFFFPSRLFLFLSMI